MISNIFKFLNLIVKFFFSWSAQVLSRELIAVISIYIYIYIYIELAKEIVHPWDKMRGP